MPSSPSAPPSSRRTSGDTSRSPCRARLRGADAVMMPRRRVEPIRHRADAHRPPRSGRAASVVVDPAGVGELPADHQGGDGRVRHERRGDQRPADRGPAGVYEPTEFRVEPDASSASYPLAAAAMVGGAVCVRGLGSNVGAGRRPVRRGARVDGMHHVHRHRHGGDAPPRHPAARDRHRHVRHVRSGPHARRGRHAGGHPDADQRCGFHPRARRATGWATSRPSSRRPAQR